MAKQPLRSDPRQARQLEGLSFPAVSPEGFFESLAFSGRPPAREADTNSYYGVHLLSVNDFGFRKSSEVLLAAESAARRNRRRARETPEIKKWRERASRLRKDFQGIESEVEENVRNWLSDHFHLSPKRVIAFRDMEHAYSPPPLLYRELDAISCFPKPLGGSPGIDTLFEVKLALSTGRGQKQRVQKLAKQSLQEKVSIVSAIHPQVRSALIMVAPNYKLQRVQDPTQLVIDFTAPFPRERLRELQEGKEPPVLLIGFEDFADHCAARGKPFSRTAQEIFEARERFVGAERRHQELLEQARSR